MKEIYTNQDIFEIAQNGDAICITTNGIVKTDGCAVMGAGIALQANKMFHLDRKLGGYIKRYGNRPFNLGKIKREKDNAVITLFSFPTKHHFKEDSNINLILNSAIEIKIMADKFKINNVYTVPPGCGLGNLNYQNTVKPWLEQIFDSDNFIVVLKQI